MWEKGEGGKGTYGCVVDEIRGWGVGVVVVVLVTMVWVPWRVEFGGMDLDGESGESVAETGLGGDSASVGFDREGCVEAWWGW